MKKFRVEIKLHIFLTSDLNAKYFMNLSQQISTLPTRGNTITDRFAGREVINKGNSLNAMKAYYKRN